MERNRFRPEFPDPLESRVVLTHGGPLTPALIGTLSSNPKPSGRFGRVVALTNDAFDRFTNDYFQAQGAYLSSGVASAPFTAFTTQRVNLLAQELTRIFAILPGSFAQITSSHQRALNKSDVLFQAILYRNINGAPQTSLLKTLNSASVVPPPSTSGAAATLYTLTATNAIQTARTALINSARNIANGAANKH